MSEGRGGAFARRSRAGCRGRTSAWISTTAWSNRDCRRGSGALAVQSAEVAGQASAEKATDVFNHSNSCTPVGVPDLVMDLDAKAMHEGVVDRLASPRGFGMV